MRGGEDEAERGVGAFVLDGPSRLLVNRLEWFRRTTCRPEQGGSLRCKLPGNVAV